MSNDILEKIISISGKPGLYKLISQTRNMVIAESILDKKRTSTNQKSDNPFKALTQLNLK